MSFNTAKIINVYYKSDRKPYDANGKPISYFGEDFVGSNEATEIRFYMPNEEDLGAVQCAVDVKRANGDKRYDLLTKVVDGLETYYKLELNDWYSAYVGKVTIAFKAYKGGITIVDGVITSVTAPVYVSDIFHLQIAYAPNSTEEVPPFDPSDVTTFLSALSAKLNVNNGIFVIASSLPSLVGGVYNGQWFLVKNNADGSLGKLYYINGSTAEEVELGLGQLNFSTTGLKTDALATGEMRYNDTTGSLDLGVKNSHTIKLGEILFKRVRNDDVTSLKVGQVVYVSGSVGNSGLLLVKKADNVGDATSSKTFGIVATPMNTTSSKDGYVYIYGLVQGVDLTDGNITADSFVAGDVGKALWLGTSGKITKTLPTADDKHSVFVGYLDSYNGAGSNCSIYVKVQNGYEIGELHDVRISAVANKNILRYNSTRQVWENVADLTTAESDIDSLEGRMTTAEGDIDSLEGRMTTAEGDIDDIEDGTTVVTKALSDQNGDVINTTYLKIGSASATYIPLSQKGVANGVVPLGSNGKVPSIYLSGEQDDLAEYANLASFPLVGETDILYVALDTNKLYRWSGSAYVVISETLALGTTNTTAFPGDRGLATETQSNNIVNGTQTLTNTRITNSAIGVEPFIVNGIAGTTSNLFSLTQNNSARFTFTNDGYLRLTGLTNISGASNSFVELNTTGSRISRNIADANPSLIVNQANASSTGNIVNFQFAGANKLEITKDGFLNQNGTRLFSQPAGITNTFFGNTSGGTATTGINNSGFGEGTLKSLTSGQANIAIGKNALASLTTSNESIAIGVSAGSAVGIGSQNTVVGSYAFGITTGSSNTGFGYGTGLTITSGSQNTFVGHIAGNNASQLATASNSTAIGYQSYTDKSNQMVFGNASIGEIILSRNVSDIKVGVGIVAPTYGLEVFRNSDLISTGSSTPLRLTGAGSTTNSYKEIAVLQHRTTATGLADGFGGFLRYTIEDSSSGQIGIARIGAVRSGANTSGRLVFDTNNAGSITEKMTILPDGKVGIGTTSPDALLTLKSTDTQIRLYSTSPTSNQYATFSFNSAGNNTLDISTGYNNDANKITFSPKNVTSMTLLGSGRVGIGTIAPDKQLEVQTANGTESAFRLRQLSQNYWDIRIPAGTTNLIINDVSAERLRIDSTGGQVGINETSPTAQLQVKSGATNRIGLIVDTLVSHSTDIVSFRNNGSAQSRILSDGSFVNGSSINNAQLKASVNGIEISRNIADTNPALIVNLQNSSATGNIQVWQKAGTALSSIDNEGYFRGSRLANLTTSNNSFVSVGNSGTAIWRNIADANPALIVNLQNASSTGNILELQGAGTTQASVAKDGIANFTGTPSNAQTVDYTLVLSDKGKVVRINSSSNLTVTIPLNSSVAFPIDTELAILRYGTGTVSISPTSGVTLNSKNSERKISGQYGSVALKKIGTDEWVLVGSLEA